MNVVLSQNAGRLGATLLALILGGCSMGFNKNGFYCTEGPVNADTPSCFRTIGAPRPAVAASAAASSSSTHQ